MENHDEGVYTIDKADMKSNVYIVMGDGATYQITQKVKSVCIDSCNKCRLFVSEVVSTVEMVNCKSCTVVVQKSVCNLYFLFVCFLFLFLFCIRVVFVF